MAKHSRNKNTVNKTRKQRRKEDRKNKKVRRNEYYAKRNRKEPVGPEVSPKKNLVQDDRHKVRHKTTEDKPEKIIAKTQIMAEQIREKEKKQQVKLQRAMRKNRKNQLLEANLEEDKNIKRLEKQLKLHKRKTTAVPASFANDGLDYLLEVCDSENLKNSGLAEQQLAEVNEDFEEDFMLMTGSKIHDKKKISKTVPKENTSSSPEDEEDDDDVDLNEKEESDDDMLSSENDEFGNDYLEDQESEDDISDNAIKSKKRTKTDKGNPRKKVKKNRSDSDNSDDDSDDLDDDEDQHNTQEKFKPSKKNSNEKNKKNLSDSELGNDDDDDDDNDDSHDVDDDDNHDVDDDDGHDVDDDDGDDVDDADSEDNDDQNSEDVKAEDDGTWEDIYGRLRSKDGAIVTAQKYIPPAARMKNESNDKVRSQKLEKLKKQLKGLMNRLAESNMHSIATQIEELYMNNSRNDMNSTITNLAMEALVVNILAPERLLMECIVLIVVLHANVGTEVGAHFLQAVVKKLDENLKNPNVEDKTLDNIVIILSQLYNFKLFDSKLVYEIIGKLVEQFSEKDIECILHILRNVGFTLRKDNPIALKNLILTLQKKAAGASDETRDNFRVKFMLDILLAIKNNNVTKIPNYDTSYSQHLKKIMKGFIRTGNYVTQLNISLEDLLKAEQKGKWWVVGSAWSGNIENDDTQSCEKFENTNSFSHKLLELASKQRMNTDTRKNIFCIIMSAEDYLDAFEKLLKLGLKNQQEREIIHVILHCCLQEKSYNPYYATLAQKCCEHDRKYQMTIKYSIWDKLKALKEHSATQISHLAKLLSYLFIEKGLPISTLKVVQFSELDKVTLRFIRQILLGILLHEDLEVCKGVFEKVGQFGELKMFSESLRLFLHHFLLRNLESQGIAEDKKDFLQQRVKIVEKLLTVKQGKFRF